MFFLDDERMVEGIAAQSAIAIENARLYQERTRTAQTLQRALLPPHLPRVPGLELGRRLPRGRRGEPGRRRLLRRLRAGRRQLGDGRRRRRQGPAGRRGDGAGPLHAARARRRRAAPSYMLTRLNDALLRERAPGFVHRRARPRRAEIDQGARVDLATAGHPHPVLAHGRRRRDEWARSGTPLGIIERPEIARDPAQARPPATCSPSTPTASARRRRRSKLLSEADLSALVAERAADGPRPMVEHLESDRGRARRRRPARRHRLPGRPGPPAAAGRRSLPGDPAGRARRGRRARAGGIGELGPPHGAGRPPCWPPSWSPMPSVTAASHGGTIELEAAPRQATDVHLNVLDEGPGFDPSGPAGRGARRDQAAGACTLSTSCALRWGSERGERHRVWLELERQMPPETAYTATRSARDDRRRGRR